MIPQFKRLAAIAAIFLTTGQINMIYADPASDNAAKGAAFLAENAKKEGVNVLPSGLRYKVEREGTGSSPKATDTVTVHYRGTLLDGTEFDSSYKRGQPISFPLGHVIPGW